MSFSSVYQHRLSQLVASASSWTQHGGSATFTFPGVMSLAGKDDQHGGHTYTHQEDVTQHSSRLGSKTTGNDYHENTHNNNHHNHHNNKNATDQTVENLIPLPDWSVALEQWGVCWQIHTFGFSVLFLLLTCFSLAIFFRFRLRVRRLKIVFNTLVLLAVSGVFRAVFLLVDPYGYQDRMAGVMVGVMTQGVYPLLCACYGLTQVMLVRITNVEAGPGKLRSLSALLGCTLSYLFLVVVIETLVFYQRKLKLLLLLDSGCFIAWALYLAVTFICTGFRLTQYASETKRARRELNAFGNQRRTASQNAAAASHSASGLSAAMSSPTTGTAGGGNCLSETGNDVINDLVSPGILSPGHGSNVQSSGVTGSSSVHDNLTNAATGINNTSFPAPQTTGRAGGNGASTLRLSRPKLKVSDHMTVTIATDEDDNSTSSTDADDGPRSLGANRSRGPRRCGHQKTRRSRSRSKASTSAEAYIQISPTETAPPSGKSAMSVSAISRKLGFSKKRETSKCSYTSISKNDEPSGKLSSAGPAQKGKSQPESYGNASELPLLNPPQSLVDTADGKIDEANKNRTVPCGGLSREPDSDDSEDGYESEPVGGAGRKKQPEASNMEEDNRVTFISGNPTNSQLHPSGLQATSESFSHEDSLVPQTQSMIAPTGVAGKDSSSILNANVVSDSSRENGYLADTENVTSCSLLSRIGNHLSRSKPRPSSSLMVTSIPHIRRHRTSHPRHSHPHSPSSSNKTSSSSSSSSSDSSDADDNHIDDDDDDDDDENTTTTTTNATTTATTTTTSGGGGGRGGGGRGGGGGGGDGSGRAGSLSPVEHRSFSTTPSLGLYRIRQSKMVQRAVHLTYLVTFLFLFACLLQLYTVFGVYGVLTTVPRPDPWPWLIFHTIFRSIEVSIGLVLVAIAFITLNHRHQRAKRRQQQQQQQLQQQQQHMHPVRDCVV
ncbi:serine-rich adhesin for platelets [Aplysia californica]|uniref:Serine-rich adhesin for platelets n=1 Tax=Aplysia californica TaxID=6500 RepID=A0ABM1A4S1_APLCA|nr:serine-rich adhesin for platelets [Aplysia californica]